MRCGRALLLCVADLRFGRTDVTLDELRALDRFREPPDEGPMCEMLWSDPQPGLGRSPSKRGVGVAFGADVTKAFLQRNGLQLLVRSHEVKEEGFEVMHDGCCVTIFSAPNYCDQMGCAAPLARAGGAHAASTTQKQGRVYPLPERHGASLHLLRRGAAPTCATDALRVAYAEHDVMAYTKLHACQVFQHHLHLRPTVGFTTRASALARSCLLWLVLREARNSVSDRSRVPLLVSLVPKISSSCESRSCRP